MRRFILAIIISVISSFSLMAQGDTTLTIRVSSKQKFPQIGLDTKGRKYFVMSTSQDKSALIDLQKGLYTDSLLFHYEKMEEACDTAISRLEKKVHDRDNTIHSYQVNAVLMEGNFKDMKRERDNLQVSSDDLQKQLKKQKIPMWAGILVGVVGGIVILDVVVD